MEVDHIVSLLNGGSNNPNNLQLLHRHCHDSKTALDTHKTGPLLVKLPDVEDKTGDAWSDSD